MASTLLAAQSIDETAAERVEEAREECGEACEPDDPCAHDDACADAHLELAREVRLFRARVIEAVEAAVETLVNDIAADVLARELELAPADIEAIVDRALRRFAHEQPLRVRVHADDAADLQCAVPVVTDARLRRGDAVIELRDGSVDATLGVRLSTLLRGLPA